MRHLFTISAIILLSILRVSAQGIVPAKYALRHLGKKVTICDKVYGANSNSNATFLYLGGDYPEQLLTIIIKPGELAKFKAHPGTDFKGKDIYVTGVIISDKGKAQIVVTNPKQIRPLLVDSPVKQIQRVN
ncbi:MAG: hypothetical protein JWP78_3348 [Mucilaginibacter sp.]|nr:hypothetical protein [Mucilaginibacter sp.]